MAQSGPDLMMLQQLQRGGGAGAYNGGLGAFNSGVVDTTTGLPQNQTLEPQMPFPALQLPPSRLEQIMSARASMRLQQFGYNQLGIARRVVVPETGAVQDDYIMGPGDEVSVSLRGQENSDLRSTVDRNGRVVLPRLAPIAVSGRSFGSFRQDVEALVRRAYVASTASVSIGRVRQISVLVSGEVNNPGQRIVTGLSSAVDAILLSGGIRKSGSLRNVRIRRGGQDRILDLYGLLTDGGSGGAMRLADGDRIIVPLLGPTVAVAGLVRRPGIYELPARAGSIAVRALLNLAGGQEVRGRYRLAVQRIETDGRLNLVTLQGDSGLVRDSEILRVELGADLAGTQATLSGGTGLAGQYAVGSGTRLSEVVRAPGALGLTPYTPFGIIVRKDQRTLMRTLVAFTPVAILSGTEDMPLQADDVIRPITVAEAQLLTFVVKTYLEKLAYDRGRIRNPLQTAEANAAPTPTQNLQQAPPAPAPARPITSDNPFGLDLGMLEAVASGQNDFSSVPADLQRANIIALLDLAAPGTMAYIQSPQASTATATGQSSQAQQNAMMTASQLGLPGGAGGINNPAVPQQPTFDQGGMNGMQNQPASANYQDQPAGAGGYASNQEVRTFGELSRQLGVDPLVLVNFLIDHRVRLDGAVRGPGSYFAGPNASLQDLVQAAGGILNWADESGVELISTLVDSRSGRATSQRQTLPLRQGNLASYIVRSRDQLHFNQVFTDTGVGSVSIQGEVRFSGNYPILRGERLSDLLMRGGGLTKTAYPAGTVFLRKSAAQVEEQGYKRAADEIQSQLLAGMARIGNDKITGEGFAAIQSFVTRLRNQKALGRIAIAADPGLLAANPAMDPLLEGGDVVFIPQRPATVAVLGEVMQPGSYSYEPGLSVADYVRKAGGYAQFSDESHTFAVMPDGSARKVEVSWLNFDSLSLPPGSSIVVPRDLAPLNARQITLDTTGIFSSLAVTIASLAVLAKQ
jgi:polysaccharide export outer membrane protein